MVECRLSAFAAAAQERKFMREAYIERKTAETDIKLSLALDGTGKGEIQTGCGFMNHM